MRRVNVFVCVCVCVFTRGARTRVSVHACMRAQVRNVSVGSFSKQPATLAPQTQR